MSRSVPNLGTRLGALALLGALWVCAAPSNARAMGCHVPDRPALGFTFTWDLPRSAEPPLVTADRPPPGFSHRPCSEDARGSSPRAAAPQPLAACSATALAAPEPTHLIAVSSPDALPLRLASRIDRPPRLRTLPG